MSDNIFSSPQAAPRSPIGSSPRHAVEGGERIVDLSVDYRVVESGRTGAAATTEDGAEPRAHVSVAADAAASGSDDPATRLITTPLAARAAVSAHVERKNTLESLYVSRDGAVAVTGWIDDASDPVEQIQVDGPGWRATFKGSTLARVSRTDMQSAAGSDQMHPYGYLGFVFGGSPLDTDGACQIDIRLRSEARLRGTARSKVCDNVFLRDFLLSYVALSQHAGNPLLRKHLLLEQGLGDQIVAINRHVVSSITSSPYIERFGQKASEPIGSIIVCLYGKPEYLFLQTALFSATGGIGDYEFVYVSNSPELSETLLREARMASQTYQVQITLVLLPGNAGFGAANNVAAAAARSRRLVFVNPDVFPKAPHWAQKHAQIAQDYPPEQSRLFGAQLYYDDGSLMHGGMYFEEDKVVEAIDGRYVKRDLLRVEHYGKGSPPDDNPFLRPRPTPAVTGAFISIDRGWYEELRGFTLDYVFGHYEDADLCLKSLEAGLAPYVHDLRLWHLEGKGSTRLPAHDGAAIVNRWLFSTRWRTWIEESLLGSSPSHPAFQAAAPGIPPVVTGPGSGIGQRRMPPRLRRT
jgi:GT2 family glycosyltransferase